ncbi:MAG: WD40 repeat domain-containing protein, partial [Planctomycetota bacterium]
MLWNTRQNRVGRQLRPADNRYRARHFAVMPDQQRIAIALEQAAASTEQSSETVMELWDSLSGRKMSQTSLQDQRVMDLIADHEQKHWVAIVNRFTQSTENESRWLVMQSNRLDEQFDVAKLDGNWRRLCALPTSGHIAGTNENGKLVTWDINQRRLVGERGTMFTLKLNEIASTPDGQQVAAADDEGRIFIWNGDEPRASVLNRNGGADVRHLAFLSGNRIVTVGRDSAVRIFRIDPDATVLRLPLPSPRVQDLVVTENAQQVVIAGPGDPLVLSRGPDQIETDQRVGQANAKHEMVVADWIAGEFHEALGEEATKRSAAQSVGVWGKQQGGLRGNAPVDIRLSGVTMSMLMFDSSIMQIPESFTLRLLVTVDPEMALSAVFDASGMPGLGMYFYNQPDPVTGNQGLNAGYVVLTSADDSTDVFTNERASTFVTDSDGNPRPMQIDIRVDGTSVDVLLDNVMVAHGNIAQARFDRLKFGGLLGGVAQQLVFQQAQMLSTPLAMEQLQRRTELDRLLEASGSVEIAAKQWERFSGQSSDRDFVRRYLQHRQRSDGFDSQAAILDAADAINDSLRDNERPDRAILDRAKQIAREARLVDGDNFHAAALAVAAASWAGDRSAVAQLQQLLADVNRYKGFQDPMLLRLRAWWMVRSNSSPESMRNAVTLQQRANDLARASHFASRDASWISRTKNWFAIVGDAATKDSPASGDETQIDDAQKDDAQKDDAQLEDDSDLRLLAGVLRHQVWHTRSDNAATWYAPDATLTLMLAHPLTASTFQRVTVPSLSLITVA